MKKHLIGLLDCNNFFVSCERLFRPDLEGKPVVVLSGNDGCIVARSQEIKDMGIPMGVPYFQVKDILKKANTTAFSSHFALYRDISRRVFTVMREELDLVEQYSVDEAFFEVTDDPIEVAKRVKNAVEKRVGIPVSVGIARSKTLAKYANSIAKKNTGIYALADEDWLDRQASVQLPDIWGVGGQMEMNYKKQGMKTVKDLLDCPDNRMKNLFGVNGLRLKAELDGQSILKLENVKHEQKSLISSRSFSKETRDIEVIKDAVAYHVRNASADLRGMGLRAGRIRVYILPSRHGDFLLRGASKEAVLVSPTHNTNELLTVAQNMIDDIFDGEVPYKKAGVSLSDFTSAEINQGSLFTEEGSSQSKWDELMVVVDSLNKQSKNTILVGTRLNGEEWEPRKELRSQAYTTSWKDLAEVKA